MADEKKEKKQKKGKDQGGGSRAAIAPTGTSNTQAVPARFAAKYTKEAVPALQKQFAYKNPMQVPKLQKIVVNLGLGQAVTNPKIIDSAVDELRAFTGQK
ncbi:MAG TPA: 50S ribosomal protein L5, partial [Labilithrix sp.]|nr:50S ribosomal protein L5 [Labilithrix sp.]